MASSSTVIRSALWTSLKSARGHGSFPNGERELNVMLMRRAFTVPKAPDIPNEDTFRLSPRKNTYALSDGASVSYDSVAWSRIVATHYVQQAAITRDWLDNCIAEFNGGMIGRTCLGISRARLTVAASRPCWAFA